MRAEQFAAKVPVAHFRVHEAAGPVWVWLGSAETTSFPDLSFGDESLYSYWCVSRVPSNWLQGIEGSIDSVHGAYLHQTWIAEAAEMASPSAKSSGPTTSLIRWRTPPRGDRRPLQVEVHPRRPRPGHEKPADKPDWQATA